MSGAIRILPGHNIDRVQWDACVASASEQNIFMYSWALDSLCDNWDGLVVENYEAVLPLPWRKKFHLLRYVYQVPFMTMLTLMGDHPGIHNIYKAITSKFRFAHFDIANITFQPLAKAARVDLFVPLDEPYTHIHERFTRECKKNIQKAIRRGCKLLITDDLDMVFQTYHKAYGELQQDHLQGNYSKALVFCREAINRKKAQCYKIVQEQSGELLYAGIILHDKNRYYYWLGAPTETGRQCRATYFLIHSLLQQHAGSNQVFDFCGSDIPNVAHFYRQFSPQESRYHEIRHSPFN
jgi:hypothetical protein